MDEQVVAASRAGFEPLLYISRSPSWARGAAVGLPGTYPSSVRFAQFAKAAALRYSGSFLPAGATTPLPRVRLWQAWNEPNAGRELTPQRVQGRAFSPGLYRTMLNAFASAIDSVHSDNLVVAGGLGPFGHNSSDIQVLAPIRFMSTCSVFGNLLPPTDLFEQDAVRHVGTQPLIPTVGQIGTQVGPMMSRFGDIFRVCAKSLDCGRACGASSRVVPPSSWVTEFTGHGSDLIRWASRRPCTRGGGRGAVPTCTRRGRALSSAVPIDGRSASA